jgi:hypothetical protein
MFKDDANKDAEMKIRNYTPYSESYYFFTNFTSMVPERK